MSVVVPVGWQVVRGPIYYQYQGEASLCLHPPGDTRVVFGCAGIAFEYGKIMAGGAPETKPYVPNVQDGWYPATDVQPCPFGSVLPGGKYNGIRPQPGVSQGLRSVGDHHADWNEWKATCDSGQSFHPQAWFLPTSHVLIFDYIGHPETKAVLASARFASDGAALPAMPTYLTAHLVSESGNTLIVQPLTTYIDNAVGKAYAKAHHVEYPFLDDSLDVETGSQRIVTLDSNTPCFGNIVLTGQNDHQQPVSCAVFGGHKGLTMGIWWNPATGVAESVNELYRP